MAETLKQKRLRLLGEAERARVEAEAASAKPTTEPPQEGEQSGMREGIRALTGSALESIPIAGPAIRGGADRLAALKRSLLDDVPYEQSLQKIQSEMPRIVEEHPYAALTGNVIGAVAGSAPMVAAAPTAFGAGAGALLPRMAASGVTNAGVGAADAYVRGQDPTTGAVVGGLFGAASLAIGDAAEGITRRALGQTAAARAPTIPQQRQAAQADYDLSRSAGLVVRPSSFGNAVNDIEQVARQAGVDPTIHPAATAALGRLRQATTNAPGQTLEQLDTLRQVIGGAAGSTNPSERRIAGLMTERLDDYLDSLTPADITAGDPAMGVQALTRARAGWRTMRKSEVIDKILRDAEIDAGANFTTAGREHALRVGFKRLSKNDKALRAFNAEEQAAIRRVATGDPGENIVRFIGKFAPRGVVSALPTMTALGTSGFGAGAAVAGIGEAGRQASNALTRRNVELVDALVRSGGQMPPTPPSPMSDATRRMVELLTIGTPTAVRASGE